MILGDICTRRCGFCNVKSGVPDVVDRAEPLRVAHAVKQMGLRHCVVTSVDRDDLPDGGAGVFADTIRAIRKRAPGCAVEVLTPDFRGQEMPLARVIDARPDVFNHNVETVPRLYPKARRGSDFKRSCRVLLNARRMDSDVDHEVRPDGRPRRDDGGDARGVRAAARARGAGAHGRAVPAALREPPAAGALLDAGRVRRAGARGVRDGLRVGRLRARSCAARTTRTSRCPSAAPLHNPAARVPAREALRRHGCRRRSVAALGHPRARAHRAGRAGHRGRRPELHVRSGSALPRDDEALRRADGRERHEDVLPAADPRDVRLRGR